ELDVAERARLLLHLARDALVPLAAESDRPVHGRAAADLLVPLGADLREIVHPNVRRAASVRPVNHDDRLTRQRHAGVERGDLRVVPLGDLAQEDVREHLARELELRRIRQIVGRDDRAEHGRDVQELGRRRLELFIAHRAVGGAEVDRARGHLLDAAAAADRLVVEADLGIHLGVLIEPLRVDRVWERRAGAVDQRLGRRRLRERARHEKRQRGEPRSLHHSPPQSVSMVQARCCAKVSAVLRICYSYYGFSPLRLVLEAVADTPDRLDAGLLELRDREFPAQARHVDVDRARLHEAVAAPDHVEELFTAEDATGRPDQGRQELELLRRELDLTALHPDLETVAIDLEVADLEARLLLLGVDGAAAAQDGADPGDQLAG